MIGLFEHQLSPATIWKFQKVQCAMTPIPELAASSIHVAEYFTEPPPREVLEQKLKAAVAIARERLAAQGKGE